MTVTGGVGRQQCELGEPYPVLGVKRVRPAYQQIADQLLELMLSGRLSVGHRLPSEADLASSFGVSRGTVREALRALASRDVIETSRGQTGGTFVRRIERSQVSEHLEASIGLMSGGDAVSVDDMLEARDVLEVPAVRLAARRRTEHHVAALQEAIEREQQTRGRGLQFRERRHFHAVVVQTSGNRLLELMTEPVFQVLQTKFLASDLPWDFGDHIDQDHREIAAAVEAGDADAAARAMREHLGRLRGAYRDRDHIPTTPGGWSP